MDPQIEELKQLVRENTVLTQETHKMVKAMHRASVWGRILKFVWIGLIVAASVGALVYLGPYLQQLQALYGEIQNALQEARELGSQFQTPRGR